MSEENKNVSAQEGVDENHPEWATTLLGQLSFCPKCKKETLLSDGIREICTACGYENTK